MSYSELLSGILIFVTGVYAYYTYRMMKATEKNARLTNEAVATTQKQMEATLRPYLVFVSQLYHNDIVYLHIRNTGKINAEKVSITTSEEFQIFGHRGKEKLSDAYIFSNTISSFPPGMEVTYALLYKLDIGECEDISPSRFTITAKYQWINCLEPMIEVTEIDLNSFKESKLAPKADIDRKLDSIKDALLRNDRRI